jgi:hypothetical protein
MRRSWEEREDVRSPDEQPKTWNNVMLSLWRRSMSLLKLLVTSWLYLHSSLPNILPKSKNGFEKTPGTYPQDRLRLPYRVTEPKMISIATDLEEECYLLSQNVSARFRSCFKRMLSSFRCQLLKSTENLRQTEDHSSQHALQCFQIRRMISSPHKPPANLRTAALNLHIPVLKSN